MKIKTLAVCILLAATGSAWAADSPGDSMTVGRYTELLVPALGLESRLPPAYKDLGAAEACQVRRSVLVAHGLEAFAHADCSQCVTRCLLAEVTFELVRRQYNFTAVTCEDKIRLLAEAGLVTAGEPGECLPANDVLRLMQLPAFTAAVAAYAAGRPMGTQPNDLLTDPFGNYRLKNVTEETASPIYPSRKK